jgi:hypothetical protein
MNQIMLGDSSSGPVRSCADPSSPVASNLPLGGRRMGRDQMNDVYEQEGTGWPGGTRSDGTGRDVMSTVQLAPKHREQRIGEYEHAA